jgi:hypothetical protein
VKYDDMMEPAYEYIGIIHVPTVMRMYIPTVYERKGSLFSTEQAGSLQCQEAMISTQTRA